MKYSYTPLVILLFCFTQTCAQDTTTVYLDKLWNETAQSNAMYYRKTVWKNETLFMFDYFINGQLQMSGQYADKDATVKTDTFKFYHRNGQLKQQGSYINDEALGEWQGWFADGKEDYVCIHKKATSKCAYYHQNGLVSAIVEFADTTLVSAQLWDSTGEVSSNIYLVVKPTFNGYEDGYLDYFRRAMTFPEDEQGNRLYGKVRFYITIDKTGKAIWGDMIGFAHPEIALAFERAVNKMPAWSPAIMYNRPVDYELRLTFSFVEN